VTGALSAAGPASIASPLSNTTNHIAAPPVPLGALKRRTSKPPERLVEILADTPPQHLERPSRAAADQKRKREAVPRDVYTVEKILNERKRGCTCEFLVRWAGYSRAHDSWEPVANILDSRLIDGFRAEQVAPPQHTQLQPNSRSRKRKSAVSSTTPPFLASQRDTVRVGAEAQASIRPVAESVLPPPAAPPLCACNQPAVWDRDRWWCEARTCTYECKPPPFALSPLCACDRPCVWDRGRWWCECGDAGCDFERRETRPEPERVCSSASRRIVLSSIEGTLATSTASLLTHAAYGLEEWSFVAPTDCGLGLFARDKIQTHQVIGEYAGPHLPLKLLKQSTYAFEIPGTNEFVDGDGSNSPCSLIDGPANAIFANHSSSKPNAKIEVQARDRKVSAFEACEPRHRIFLVATEPIAAGAEIRFDYEAGKKVSATQSSTSPCF